MRVSARRSWFLVILVCILAAVLALGIFGCGGSSGGTGTTAAGGASGTPLVIAAAIGLTGDAASGDVPLSEAMKYSVDTLNKSGGIAGHPITLIIKDMKSDPALGATVAAELLGQGADIMVGPAFPGMAVGVIQAAAAKNVAVLGGVSTQPEYVKVGGAKAYLVAFGDNVQAAAMADYALKQGYKTVYTLVSPDLSYTAKLPVFFNQVFAKGGGKEIGSDTFSVGQTGFLGPGDQDRRSQSQARLHLHRHVRARCGHLPEATARGRRHPPRSRIGR